MTNQSSVTAQCRPTVDSESFFVVTSSKGKVGYTSNTLSGQVLQRYGFSVGPTDPRRHRGLFRIGAGNRVALLFANEIELSDYLQGCGREAAAFPSELLAWAFV